MYRGCLDLVETDYQSLLRSLMRVWSSLVAFGLIPDTLTKSPSSCLPSLIQSRVCCLRAWGILANIERLLYPLELLCWLTYTEALSCSIEHVINTLWAWHVTKMLSQLTLPRHYWFAMWQDSDAVEGWAGSASSGRVKLGECLWHAQSSMRVPR